MGAKSDKNIIKRIREKIVSFFRRKRVLIEEPRGLVVNRTCDELSIYAFDKARSTSDLKWLIEGYTGREKVD